jgi:hypothetical protein
MNVTYFERTAFLAAILLFPAAANANVITQAIVSGGNTTYVYAYNGPLAGLSANTGAGTLAGCDAVHGDACSGAGTTDSAGKLNSSFDTVSMSQPFGDTGSAYASANLPSGVLRASATGSGYINTGGFESCCTGQALAQFGDILHFSVAGASSTTVTNLVVNFRLDGTLAIDAGLTGGVWEAQVDDTLTFGNGHFREQDTVLAGGSPTVTFLNQGGWVSHSETESSPGNYLFTGIYSITGSTADVPVGDALTVFAGGANSDFAHTGTVTVGLPSGVTFTSDNGLLSAPVSSAPEPGTWLLLGSGLAAAVISRVRRRRF